MKLTRSQVALFIGVALLLGAAAVFAYGLDKWLSRPDRMEYTQQVNALYRLRDAILCYEYEHGSLPARLQDLSPRYVPVSQMQDKGKWLYQYDPIRRRVSMDFSTRISGVFVREWSGKGIDIPATQSRPAVVQAVPRAGTSPTIPAIPPPPVLVVPPPPAMPPGTPPLMPAPVAPVIPARVTSQTPVQTAVAERDPAPIVEPATPPVAAPAEDVPDGVEEPAQGRVVQGVLHVPPRPEGLRSLPGALVLEAEHFTELNWGWKVRPDPTASGGFYLECPEGTTAGSSQAQCGIFDFWNVREKSEYTVLKYHFHLKKAGSYYLLGRLWATDYHCSNSINVGIDKGGLIPELAQYKEYYGVFMGSGTPFRWVWGWAGTRAIHLSAGDHYIHIFPHEDGIRIDQLMLVPANQLRSIHDGRIYQANLLPGRHPGFQTAGDTNRVHLSFDTESAVISPVRPTGCRLIVRKIRAAEGRAEMQVTMAGAGRDGADLDVARFDLDLATLPEISYVDLDFDALNNGKLPRREYLLTARLTRGAEQLAESHRTFVRPFDWEVSTDLGYLKLEDPGPLDADTEAATGSGLRWVRFSDTNYDALAVMDFGLHTVGNSLHCPELRTIYGRTSVNVLEPGVYMFKMQADDQMLLWLDGKLVYRHELERPVTRSAKRLPVRLEAGVHRLRIRVNQSSKTPKLQGGRWQAALRIRTSDDQVSNITGVESPAP